MNVLFYPWGRFLTWSFCVKQYFESRYPYQNVLLCISLWPRINILFFLWNIQKYLVRVIVEHKLRTVCLLLAFQCVGEYPHTLSFNVIIVSGFTSNPFFTFYWYIFVHFRMATKRAKGLVQLALRKERGNAPPKTIIVDNGSSVAAPLNESDERIMNKGRV